jgi:phosphoribosylaminoimidazolecarboxamide formyltransferase / IMP cyclohydrolase
MKSQPIKRVLISVFTKEPYVMLAKQLHHMGAELISTGGTGKALSDWGLPWTSVESLTGYPSVFGGRVKTLHPMVFGGLLQRDEDQDEAQEVGIDAIDMAIVELYPFREAVAEGSDYQACIEKIDIGGVSLIRAAAKNHQRVLLLSGFHHIQEVQDHIMDYQGSTPEFRLKMAVRGFEETAAYDRDIQRWLSLGFVPEVQEQAGQLRSLRYGENPHQKGFFQGNLDRIFKQHSGKEISYNNVLDLDAGWLLMREAEGPDTAVLKHNVSCGASRNADAKMAWEQALVGDPVSAFGGVVLTKHAVDMTWAESLNQVFFEILVAPSYTEEALELLRQKKNRILLEWNPEAKLLGYTERSALGGVLIQETDRIVSGPEHWDLSHCIDLPEQVVEDMKLARVLVKHAKSNAIVLVKKGQLIGIGAGQVSRIDAVRQAIAKAQQFNHEVGGAVMASDAFFPFADGIETAAHAGIEWVWQPGGSIRDAEVLAAAREMGVQMVLGGTRHFKH